MGWRICWQIALHKSDMYGRVAKRKKLLKESHNMALLQFASSHAWNTVNIIRRDSDLMRIKLRSKTDSNQNIFKRSSGPDIIQTFVKLRISGKTLKWQFVDTFHSIWLLTILKDEWASILASRCAKLVEIYYKEPAERLNTSRSHTLIFTFEKILLLY